MAKDNLTRMCVCGAVNTNPHGEEEKGVAPNLVRYSKPREFLIKNFGKVTHSYNSVDCLKRSWPNTPEETIRDVAEEQGLPEKCPEREQSVNYSPNQSRENSVNPGRGYISNFLRTIGSYLV